MAEGQSLAPLAATDRQRLPLCTGFIFNDWRSSDDTVVPGVGGDVLAFTSAYQELVLPGAVPWGEESLSEAGNGSLSPATSAAQQRRWPILLQTDALGGAEVLLLVDWICIGKRLAMAQLPDPSWGPYRLLLPGGDPAARICGYAHGRGIFPLAAVAGDSGREAVPSRAAGSDPRSAA